MRRCPGPAWPLLLGLVLWAAPAGAGWLVHTGLRGSLADVGRGMTGTLELGADAIWLPVEEVGLGLQASLLLPLHVAPGAGSEAQQAEPVDLGLRLLPAAWLRFGRDEAWGYVRAGLGLTAQLRGDRMEPGLLIAAGGGFAVAPRQLPFHFGFELAGAIELAGAVTDRGLGVGAFIGWAW
jgi:hypothetical protein